MVDIAEVQAFFFRAMREGYAASGRKAKVAGMPGYKEIRFSEGDFLLVDRYCVTPHSSKSVGTTTIWFNDVPVWVMNYGGYYTEEVIPFLKNVLSRTYGQDRFIGGRGPFEYSQSHLLYVNRPSKDGFEEFKGREEIFYFVLGRWVSHGFHEYWGMSLL